MVSRLCNKFISEVHPIQADIFDSKMKFVQLQGHDQSTKRNAEDALILGVMQMTCLQQGRSARSASLWDLDLQPLLLMDQGLLTLSKETKLVMENHDMDISVQWWRFYAILFLTTQMGHILNLLWRISDAYNLLTNHCIGNPFWKLVWNVLKTPSKEKKDCQQPKHILLDIGEM
ncbi:neutral/alkaline non-lysosomal ceramidase [Artemisia annua]|uniref:Neutral/alkaline non-lysosomal ceramidase n=1 Tax=Artemisia annua TaxID=35608 RepID=A0A2U1NPQ9_ARTAN|nr:neutral/alkaline non-lysosomal ceramidase [Artemisia annua]